MEAESGQPSEPAHTPAYQIAPWRGCGEEVRSTEVNTLFNFISVTVPPECNSTVDGVWLGQANTRKAGCAKGEESRAEEKARPIAACAIADYPVNQR